MITKIIKQLFTPKPKEAVKALAGSREAKKKAVQRAKTPVSHKANSYPAKKHGINPKYITEAALNVTKTLSEAGFEAYIVGGAVRDLMQGLQPKDFDVATNARPEQIVKLFRRARIIGRRFRIVHVPYKRDLIEVTTFRANTDNQDTDAHGRVLRDNEFGSLQDDAVRRDLSVNALYYDAKRQVVLDYHGGVGDLNDQVLRVIGDPETRFREDPVRMLRVLRFMAKLDFDVDEATLDAMEKCKPLLGNIPQARLFDETLKFFTTGHASASLDALQSHDFTEYLMPVLADVLDLDKGATWVRAMLEQTDARVNADKSVSPGFLFAALMWPKIEERWAFYQKNEPQIAALDMAIAEIINQSNNGDQIMITKRFVSDMREIWNLQPRLERRLPRQAINLVEHPRFRAAYDFLLLRAQLGHLGAGGLPVANWWGELYDAPPYDREQMINDLRNSPKANLNHITGQPSETPKRKRRRRKKPNSKVAAESATAE
ncbi:poly(A) polymerase I [Formosimonas limnophila]|uniref:Poly(A) polymerase I n=1 Tax=Formosimonas limnophila TaxID=1384487 RepID=A0A8J3CLH6_9BURK|nr:polynucleotide adenylyltransferase PcnB [Formosimonas limnophila]GHA76419.1 poly(A) polymerase I [Formosimonas limnophila]